jgi:hypothetical protein
MIIPKKFKLAGRSWVVKFDDRIHEFELNGRCQRDTGTILISTKLDQEAQEITFLHELFHAMKFTLGDAGVHNEVEVDGMARILHQYLSTAK